MSTPAEIAAYIGAAAWLPIVIAWVYQRWVKPFVTITPDKTVSIGYTRLGPIFNLNMAVSIEKKDAILEHIGVKLTHENGDSHDLVWMGMAETFSQIRDSAGTQQIVEKEHQAIAVRLSMYLLTERFVRFQDPSFHEAVRDGTNSLLEHIGFLRANNRYVEVMASRQVHDLVQQMRGQNWWQPGKYIAEFHIRSPHRAELRDRKFAFTLSQGEIDRIRANLDLMQDDLEDVLRQDEQGYTQHKVDWQWVNVRFSPV